MIIPVNTGIVHKWLNPRDSALLTCSCSTLGLVRIIKITNKIFEVGNTINLMSSSIHGNKLQENLKIYVAT